MLELEVAISETIRTGNKKELKRFIEEGIFTVNRFLRVRVNPSSQLSPLFLAFHWKRIEIFYFLVRKGADVDQNVGRANGLCGNQMTLIHFAVLCSESIPYLKILLRMGAKVNLDDKWGRTPLHLAAHKGHLAVVELLTQNGATINAVDELQETPLDKAIRGGHSKIISHLISLGGKSSLLVTKYSYLSSVVIDISIVGDEQVGKSAVLHRYGSDEFPPPPKDGVTRHALQRSLGGTVYKLAINDIGGSERTRGVAPVYYRNSDIVMVCLDVNQPSSFEGAKDWIMEVQSSCLPDTLIVLVGNKIDLQAQFPESGALREQIRSYAKEMNMFYIETSSKESSNIHELFNYSLKIFHQLCFRHSKYSKSSVAELTTKNLWKARPKKPRTSTFCYFEDLRTGKMKEYQHITPLSNIKAMLSEAFEKRCPHKKTWKFREFKLIPGYLVYSTKTDGKLAETTAIILRGCSLHSVDKEKHGTRACIKLLSSNMRNKYPHYLFRFNSSEQAARWFIELGKECRSVSCDFAPMDQLYIPSEEIIRNLDFELAADGNSLSFVHSSVLCNFVVKYPVLTPLEVCQDLHNPRQLYLTDGNQFVLSMSGSASLIEWLRRNLPRNTYFGPMKAEKYFQHFLTVYLHSCERNKRPLLIDLMEQIFPSFTCIILTSLELVSEDIEAIMNGLVFYPLCFHICLKNISTLDSIGYEILFNEIKYNKYIRSLQLINCVLDDIVLYHHAVQLLRANKTLTTLSLRELNIQAESWTVLLQSLADNSTLQSLDLSSNQLTDEVTPALCTMLMSPICAIQTLSLNDNLISGRSCASLDHALTENKSLMTIELKGNKLSEGQILHLISCLTTCRSAEKPVPSSLVDLPPIEVFNPNDFPSISLSSASASVPSVTATTSSTSPSVSASSSFSHSADNDQSVDPSSEDPIYGFSLIS